VKVRRWGNSLALRLPMAVAMDAGVTEGSSVDVVASDGTIVVRPRRRFRLADLLASVTRKNIHTEVDSGAPVGIESW
jgi:antitoxin MazE